MVLFAQLITAYFSMTVVEPLNVLSHLVARPVAKPHNKSKRCSSVVNAIRTHRAEMALYKQASADYTMIQRPVNCW